MMQKIFLVFVSLACFQIGLVWTTKLTLRESFDKIEERLYEKVDSDDVQQNIEEARNWLKELEKENNKCFIIHRSTTCSLIRGLDALTNLDGLVQGSCDARDGNLLAETAAASRLNEQILPIPRSRIEKIVHFYTRQHYKSCYPAVDITKFERLGRNLLRYALNVAKEAIMSTNLALMAADVMKMARLNTALGTGLDKAQARRHQVSKEEFFMFLVKPCEEIERMLADDSNKDDSTDSWQFEYFMSLDQLYALRRVEKNCEKIVKFGNEIYPAMVIQMQQEERERRFREAEEYARQVRQAEEARQAYYDDSSLMSAGASIVG